MHAIKPAVRKSTRFQRFVLIILFAFWISALPEMSIASTNCSNEDKEYAKSWNDYYNPEDAYKFGNIIKQFIAGRDLDGLFGLVIGELQNGPRKRFIETRTFNQVFTEEWRSAVLASETPCQPVGWRGFMLANGLVWFNNDGKPPGTWQIVAMNGAAKEGYLYESPDPAWRVDGRIVPPQCFVKILVSADNFRVYEETFGIADAANFRRNTGQYFGREIDRLDPIDSPWGNGKVPLATFLDICSSTDAVPPGNSQTPPIVNADSVSSENCYEGSCTQYAYRLLAPISQAECQNLAPHLPGRCESAYLVRIGDYSGGSIGWDFGFNIYGLFRLDDGRNAFVPLVNFNNENNARNFIDSLLISP